MTFTHKQCQPQVHVRAEAHVTCRLLRYLLSNQVDAAAPVWLLHIKATLPGAGNALESVGPAYLPSTSDSLDLCLPAVVSTACIWRGHRRLKQL